jgi:hypothetical protein
MELTNHTVPADVLRTALQENMASSHTVVGTIIAVIPPSASDPWQEEPPAPWAPSAPPGLTSDLTTDRWSVVGKEDQEVQLLKPARWLQSGTCEVWHGKDAAGRDLWSDLPCVEPACRIARMTRVMYGFTPMNEAQGGRSIKPVAGVVPQARHRSLQLRRPLCWWLTSLVDAAFLLRSLSQRDPGDWLNSGRQFGVVTCTVNGAGKTKRGGEMQFIGGEFLVDRRVRDFNSITGTSITRTSIQLLGLQFNYST